MALILDTRFLIAHTFPPSDEGRRSIANFLSRISKEKLIIPSIVITEFMRVAGTRLGAEQARIKLKLWTARGAGVLSVDEETAFPAGELALRHKDIPIADVIIGAVAKQHKAAIITDDPHFKILNLKTVWYKRPDPISDRIEI
ncbi:type II toxin-antitoxin system VapC family toxin [Candidatus Korarchaeum cryptofilum]|uniref:Type II toxin-antitoxin system VapC family toxin n=2 Tax=Candidatus Korarchaeia TaxID=3342163 RepID=A0A3R9QXJ8_9CREN|nr:MULTISPECIES: PIN domain-containing protein [Candidatus Korarchaeota]RSN68610.1 type II toxin-antitoxin system VapC family toxin [Candidatus Korarchaeum cryptofilum]RSN74433.1 type II toxin-antitoxin system VapC family toxin [Candidatus Methanodesulfokores washburnensis]